MKNNVVIGIDLGGTKLASAIFDNRGKILHREISPLNGKGGKEVGRLIKNQIKQLLSVAEIKRLTVRGIGVSVPGISYQESGKVWAPNIPGWENYPLRKEICSLVKNRKIRVEVESDRACYILGESWKGAAKNCKNAIFLAVGTGIGAGIMVDGNVLRGANDIAGAIGWLALQRPFRGEYIKCGCFEHHASGEGLKKIAMELLARDKKTSSILRRNKDFTTADIFTAFESGDPIAENVLDQAIGFWGMATANLVSLFNPEKIIFGGGVFGPATKFFPNILNEAKKWAQPISIAKVNFEASGLGTDAGIYGAAHLAWRSLDQRD